MSQKTVSGLPLVLLGIAMGVGYYLYVAHELSAQPEQLSVSLKLPVIALLLVVVGTMQLTIGEERTKELLTFNTYR